MGSPCFIEEFESNPEIYFDENVVQLRWGAKTTIDLRQIAEVEQFFREGEQGSSVRLAGARYGMKLRVYPDDLIRRWKWAQSA